MEENRFKNYTSWYLRTKANLRQLFFPKEFRIGPSAWSPTSINALEKLLQAISIDQSSESPAVAGKDTSKKDHMHFLADVGTGLWRIRNKMVKPGTNEPLEEMRRVYRHLESTLNILIEAGLEIQDHTDTPYDPGMSLRVLTFQPTERVDRETVIETIKPTIYYKGQSIQLGEVIVGTPLIPNK
jgi:hypothetical protein